jgi:S1-C subfamily serine protease
MNHLRPLRKLASLAVLALAALAITTGCIPDDFGLPTPPPAQPTTAPQQAPPAGGAQSVPSPVPTLPSQRPQQAPAPGTAPPAFPPQAQEPAASAPAPAPRNVSARVYQQESQSVVNISSVALVPTGFGSSQQAPRGTGSGFVIDEQGHIVTNNHVVEDADELVVTFKDGTTFPAVLVGRDPPNNLAVIRVDPAALDARGNGVTLKPVRLGDSDQTSPGEDAIAIGSPLGLEQTVTSGIVSAVRSPTDETISGQLQLLGGAIQTDAAINPGNSGGPLFNADGEVIGVNTAILSGTGGNIGIGFAIPVNVVRRVVPALIASGCYRHPLIGVVTVPLSALGQALKRELGIPQEQNGLIVQEVSQGAAQAGLRAGTRRVQVGLGQALLVGGDIIVAIDGLPVAGGGQLRAYIENNKRPGETVTITVLRDGERRDIPVTLSEAPNDQCRPSR